MRKLQAGVGVVLGVLLAMSGGAQAQPRPWLNLGCRAVGFAVDHDVIAVAPRPGGYTTLRIVVKRNEIFMMNLKVIYGNGEPDELPVRALMRPNTTSGPLDLRGARRQITRIDLLYRSRPDFRGQAEVCVEGRPG